MLRLPSSMLLSWAPHKVHSGLELGTGKSVGRMPTYSGFCLYPSPNLVVGIKQKRFKEEKAWERKSKAGKGH